MTTHQEVLEAAKKAAAVSELQKTGGPAFPTSTRNMFVEGGLTIRDHFAGLAMQGRLGQVNQIKRGYAERAEDAYLLADAMMEARK